MYKTINLKLISECDLDFIAKIKTNKGIWEYEDYVPNDEEEVKKIYRKRLTSESYKQYLVCLSNPDSTIVGELHIHWYVKERESWEVGYAILPEYQRMGFGSQALDKILDIAFNQWNAHKVVAMCNEYNIGSYKILEKVGMKREGVFRKELPWNNIWANQYFYSILENEYKKGLS